MTEQEVLTKAITQAIAGGWKAHIKHKALWVDEPQVIYHGPNTWGSPSILFNHDFAKSLWGKEHKSYAQVFQRVNNGVDVEHAVINGMLQAWQYHLQQMVISENPIKYLKEHM